MNKFFVLNLIILHFDYSDRSRKCYLLICFDWEFISIIIMFVQFSPWWDLYFCCALFVHFTWFRCHKWWFNSFDCFVRYELRVRYLPRSFQELYARDKVTFYYLYDQVSESEKRGWGGGGGEEGGISQPASDSRLHERDFFPFTLHPPSRPCSLLPSHPLGTVEPSCEPLCNNWLPFLRL